MLSSTSTLFYFDKMLHQDAHISDEASVMYSRAKQVIMDTYYLFSNKEIILHPQIYIKSYHKNTFTGSNLFVTDKQVEWVLVKSFLSS